MTISFSVSTNEKILVKAGQDVDFKTPLVKKTFQRDVKIPISHILQIAPGKIFHHLLKVVGEEIKKGDVLGKKKSLMGEKEYISEFDGIIKEINHEDGSLVISSSTPTQKIKHAYFKGEVTDVKKNEITLRVKKAKDFELKDISDDFGGEIKFLDDNDLVSLTPEEVDDKVVFDDTIAPYNEVKLEVMGAVGFVTLHKLTDKSSLPSAVIENSSDWKVMKTLDYPYCLTSKKNSRIYFYA